MDKISSLIQMLRPKQWTKNAFVFLPMFFATRLFDPQCWRASVLVFIAFSLMASAVYCLNDIIDVDDDRRHPLKRLRPLASGKVTVKAATIMAILLAVASGSIARVCPFGLRVAAIICGYLLLNIAYCLKLKQIDIVDVFIISFGFVLRLVAGGVACNIILSPWIVLMTFLLTLFLAFAKRRDDVVIREQKGIVSRSNTTRYNLSFMNMALAMIGAITIVCYVMYCVNPDVQARIGSNYVYATSVFVLAGILRYLQIAIVDMKSGSPTKILLTDRFIQICIACWILLFIFLLYL